MHSSLTRTALAALALLTACAAPAPAGPFVVATLEPTRDSTTHNTV